MMPGGAPPAALAPILARAEALYHDHQLAAVRDWKRRTGGLAVGYMPIWVPRELLHAQGVLPVGLVGGGEDVEIIRGDAYYQSYICHIPRSTIELGLGGAYDALDGVLFPAICDVIRNLSGVWKIEFPAKLSRYLDVPQNFDRDVGGRFLRGELESLAADLAARGAAPLAPAALARSIDVYNDNRRRVRELYDLRAAEPWRVPTHELYLVLRAGLLLPVEEFSALLTDYRAALDRTPERRPLDQARVVLAGSFCEQPPLGLLITLERSGCYIVDDDLLQVHRWIAGDIVAGADPLGALVQAFLDQSLDSPTRYVDRGQRGAALVERCRAARAEGILFCAPSFCDPALLDQPLAVAAVERAGIPWTAFKYAENNGQFQVIREQAGTFADSIKLWSGEPT